MPTWEELIELEPGLALLEHEVLKVQDRPERPYFCANAYWFGPSGAKAELVRLVGTGRRMVSFITDWDGPLFVSLQVPRPWRGLRNPSRADTPAGRG